MANFRLGATGPEVRALQQRLFELGLYRGGIDGRLGGATESAIIVFQRANGLTVDGRVGDQTWRALFGESVPAVPAITQQPLDYRCLALTASIETSQPPPECFSDVVGDFDGQGLSFGALQFSLGPGTLGKLLTALDQRAPELLDSVFHEHARVLRTVIKAPRDEQLAWARSIQHPGRRVLDEPWNGMFRALGRTAECQQAQVAAARRMFDAALALVREYGLWSDRAVALMFDIVVQNGSIAAVTEAQILADFARLPALEREAREVEQMLIVAQRRAAACKPQWAENVRIRKTTIARGRGVIHGRAYDLEQDYAIGLRESVKPPIS